MSTPSSFERDVAPLFRDSDVEDMKWAFDLRSYDDVKANASAILERVEEGSMPCDEEWPGEKVDAFRAWIDSGMAP
jgi:hypothetical protein